MIDIKFTKFIQLLYQGVPNRAEVCYKDRISLGLFDINTPKELVNDINYFLPVFENILGVGDGGRVTGELEPGGGVSLDLQQVRRRRGPLHHHTRAPP